LSCSNNRLTTLDVSSNIALTSLYCGNNQFTSLDLRNGANAIITRMDATANANLACIYVDDKSAAYLADWDKDASSNFVDNEAECSEFSAITNNLAENTDFILYPNPVKNQFVVETNKLIETISIYNTNGALVKTFSQSESYSVSDLPKGMYFIKIQSNGQSFAQKIIIE
jgi:hypothetical protein